MSRKFEAVAGVPGRQRGISLVMALIFLTVMILMGTSATVNTNLQERMAGNTRNRDLAFEAAEAALRAAGSTLLNSATRAAVPAYYPANANDAAYWAAYDWTNSGSYPSQTISQVHSQPKYVVEKMPTVGTTEYYRVTARGVGGDSNAVVILQALYSYRSKIKRIGQKNQLFPRCPNLFRTNK